MKYRILILITSFFASVFVGYNVNAQSAACDELDFYSSLAQSESGGCDGGTGSGNQYDCVGPIINNGGIHDGDRPLGMYQFMPNTLGELGIPVEGFVGNAAAQEEAIRRFNQRNNNCLNNSYTSNGITYPPASDAIGTTIDGVVITRSGLLGASHLSGCGGARRMIRTQGSGASDQLGTSALGYAARFGGYAVFEDSASPTCGGGVPGAAGIFAQAQVDGLHNMIGCDPAVLESSEALAQALVNQENEIIRSSITQPAPVEQLTCADQRTELSRGATNIHSNPSGNNTSIASLVQQPLAETLQQFTSGNIAGSITDIVNTQFNDVVASFTGLLGGGLGGAAPTTNCDMQEQAWLISQCIEMPELPSLSNIIGGRLGELAGTITGAPDRLIERVCQGMNSTLGDAFNNADAILDNAARAVSQPLSDAASTIR